MLDQDVFNFTANFLNELGHDIVRASDLGLGQASDEELLMKADELNRLLITRDRDYGSLVFVRSLKVGVLYLRILPARIDSVHKELERVLTSYSEDDLRKSFVVIEAGKHRFRHI